MKKVITGKLLQDKMCEAINLLCGTVKTTLGPKGSNVIIDHSSFNPFITNDGVTIAENIESDDEVINTILEIAKEASIKTNELVGDGTTSTLVLLESIFNNGIKLIMNGKNPMVLKKELNDELNKILPLIDKQSRKPDKKELTNIARVSANDKAIGDIISKAYFKVKNKNAISIKESEENETKVNFLNGYSISTNIASPYFFKNTNIINLHKPYILLINNYLNNINEIANVINFIMNEQRNLIVIANDYDEQCVNEITSMYLDDACNIILLKSSEYGINELITLEDIEVLSNAKINNESDNININSLGLVKEIKIDKEITQFIFDKTEKTTNRIFEIKKQLKNDSNDIEHDFNLKRLAMFNNGLTEVLVGAPTITERREKKMRFDDALWAIDAASNGILPGAGITLLKISNELNENTILKSVLDKPFKQILYNAGLDYNLIYENIKKYNFEKLYNVLNEEYEYCLTSNVLDATSIVKNSLINAVSISSMLLTTTSLIINEYTNNIKSFDGYNEI